MSKATLRVSLAAEPGLRPARPHGKPTANKHSSSPNSSILFRSRVPRCDASCMADARCYAARYPDLHSLCAGGSPCRFAELLNHFQQHGRKENRTYHCFYTVRPVPPRCKPGPKQIEEQTTPVDTVSSDSFLSPASTCILLTIYSNVDEFDSPSTRLLSRHSTTPGTSRNSRLLIVSEDKHCNIGDTKPTMKRVMCTRLYNYTRNSNVITLLC